MSKGSDRRPLKVSEEAFADNWSRIFGLSGRSSTAEQVALTHPVVCSNQTAPAIYVDDATGKQVSEEWWPGMPHDAT